MARLHGRRGRLYVDVTGAAAAAIPVAFLTKWEINFSTDDTEVTSLDDTNKIYLAGLPDASGSINGWYDDATVQLYTLSQSGAAAAFYLYPSTAASTKYWYGTAIFDFKVTGGVSEAISISGNWKAASTITKNP